MRYLIEPKHKVYVKGYGFLSFAKTMGKNLNCKCSQKVLYSAKKSTTDVIKTASKRAIQKTAEATGDLIGNKLADKIKKISIDETEVDVERGTTTKKDIYISGRKTTNY